MFTGYRTVVARVAIVAAVLLAVAAAWDVLFQARVVVPGFADGGDNQAYFAWWRPIEWQTIGIALLATAGFGAIAVLGFAMGGAGGAGLAMGGVIAMVAQLAQMGGQHAVLRASETTIDPGILGTIGFVADGMSSALFVGAYTILGLGVLGLTLRDRPVTSDAFGRASGIALAAALVVLAVLSLGDPLDVSSLLMVIVAIVLAPVWLWRVAIDSSSPHQTTDVVAAVVV